MQQPVYTRVSPTWIKYNSVIPSGFAIAGNINGINTIADMNSINMNGLNGIGNMNGISALNGINTMAAQVNGVNGMNGMGNGMGNGVGFVNGNTAINGINGLAGISTLNGINALANLSCQTVNGLNGINGINALNGLHQVNGINGNNTGFPQNAEQERSMNQNHGNGNGVHSENIQWSSQYPVVCIPESSQSGGMNHNNGNNKGEAFHPQITFQFAGAPRPEFQNTNGNTTTTSVYAPITTAGGPRFSTIPVGNPLANGIQTMQFTRPMTTEFTSPIMKFVGPGTFLPLRPSMSALDTLSQG